jgi:hypothetical protein
MDVLYDCLKTPAKYGYEKEYFWISGISLVLVGIVGLVGNVISLLMLCRKNFHRNVFYNLLIMLTLFDITFIISLGISAGYESMACRDNYIHAIGSITYPVSNIGLSGSIYTTVAVSIERYLRLRHPRLKYSGTSWVYITSVVVITVLYNLPRFFEFKYSVVNGTLISEQFPWTATAPYDDVYHVYAEVLVESFIPTILLLIFNGAIIKMVYFSKTRNTNVEKSRNRATNTKILLAIVGVFFVTHLPSIAFTL